MSQTIKEIIKVDSLGKWGPKVGNEFLSWSKNLKDADKGRVVPGGTYEMELYVAESGKRYINSVSTVSTGSVDMSLLKGNSVLAKAQIFKPEGVPNSISPITKVQAPKVFVTLPKKSEEMTRSDWDNKDRRISRQGVIQVAVQVTSNFDDAVVLANRMLEFVNS